MVFVIVELKCAGSVDLRVVSIFRDFEKCE